MPNRIVALNVERNQVVALNAEQKASNGFEHRMKAK